MSIMKNLVLVVSSLGLWAMIGNHHSPRMVVMAFPCTSMTTTTTRSQTSSASQIFLQDHHHPRPGPRLTTQLNALESAVASIDAFYHTQPFLSAFLTCSVKASMADLLAQTSAATSDLATSSSATSSAATIDVEEYKVWSKGPPSSWSPSFLLNDETRDHHQYYWDTINVPRNLAFVLYGGLYQGMFLQFQYSQLYPHLFGDSEYRVMLQVISDVFVFGPLLTLPLAYVLRAFLDNPTTTTTTDDGTISSRGAVDRNAMDIDTDGTATTTMSTSLVYSVQQGLSKYKNHIETQDLLTQYWKFWGPAQVINQGFVPPHLRVAFVAAVGFFWIILLSAISSQNDTSSSSSSSETTSTPGLSPKTTSG